MALELERRTFVFAGLCVLGGCSSFKLGEPPALSGDALGISDVEVKVGGRIGVGALDTASGKRISYRGGERFAMCSTFKWMLAAAVLARVDRGEITLASRIPYGAADILDPSPVATAHLSEGAMSIAELCGAAVEISDNTAANLLLRSVGGPQGVTRYLRSIGDTTTRLDRTEPSLNSNLKGDPRDTTTPDAIVRAMDKILVGNALSAASRARLIDWMKACRTGYDRLRKGLPGDWVVGDKTGTGDNGEANDNAIAWPPGRAPILIACYVDSRDATPEGRDAAQAAIAAIVAQAFA